MILIDGVYVNNSGGKVLLDLLLAKFSENFDKVYFLLDHRVKDVLPVSDFINVKFIKPSLLERHRFYKDNSNRFKSVLCFGNVPPTISLPSKVYTYFHNVLLFDLPKSYGFTSSLKKRVKGLIVKSFASNTDEFWVQTEQVKMLLENHLSSPKIKVLPFYRDFQDKVFFNEKPKNSFVYLSNGNKHKNHVVLLNVWEKLFDNNMAPSLTLTVSKEYKVLINQIERLVEKGLNITNLGFTSPSEIFKKNRYLIYPSLKESFGLGLVEAVNCNSEVICANLPYALEIVKPYKVFDPSNEDSLLSIVLETLREDDLKVYLETECIIGNNLNIIYDTLLNETNHPIL